MAGRNHWRSGISWKFSGGSWCLRVGPVPDGTRLRHGHHVSHSENVEIVPGERIVLLPFQSEVCGQNSESRLGVCSIGVCLDWIEFSQWLDPLSGDSGQ